MVHNLYRTSAKVQLIIQLHALLRKELSRTGNFSVADALLSRKMVVYLQLVIRIVTTLNPQLLTHNPQLLIFNF